ncbi:MAG: type I polyketide synthase [Minicystis sp.]
MSRDVAIIGMAGRYPGADTLDEYWKRLVEGRSLATELPRERAAAYDGAVPRSGPRWGTFLEGIDLFDAGFFGFDAAAAAALGPDLRVFFEVAWHALEDAGYARRGASALVGVFVGCGHDHYQSVRVRAGKEAFTAGAATAIANRLSSFLDWTGPSFSVATLCTSALTALHLAVGSLLSGECDLALVGGVHVGIGPDYLASAARLGVLSPSGACRPFDANADGYVPGEGAGALVIKPLAAAERDRDPILGVVRGTALVHGGAESQGLALNFGACVAALKAALARADLAPESVGLVESPAVGSPLGDAIEISALRRALWAERRPRPCLVSSVKPIMGHLEAAAGMAGIQKVLLSFRHGLVPATPVADINPSLEVDDRLFVAVEQHGWDQWPGPWRACVGATSTYGLAAQVVLEAPPPRPRCAPAAERPRLLTLSARDSTTLERMALGLAEHEAMASASLAAICDSLNGGREPLQERLAVVARSSAELESKLRRFVSGEAPEGLAVARAEASLRPALVLGGSSATLARGAELAKMEAPFAREIERVLGEVAHRERADAVRRAMIDGATEPRRSAPALVAFQIALCRLWLLSGLEPSAVAGHGWGEIAAAVVAGALGVDEALSFAETVSTNGVARAALDAAGPSAGPPRAKSDRSIAVRSDGARALADGDLRAAERAILSPGAFGLVLRRLHERRTRWALTIGVDASDREAGEADTLRTAESLVDGQDASSALLVAAATLWTAGCKLRWVPAAPEDRADKVALPLYPFQRQRFWLVESAAPGAGEEGP